MNCWVCSRVRPLQTSQRASVSALRSPTRFRTHPEDLDLTTSHFGFDATDQSRISCICSSVRPPKISELKRYEKIAVSRYQVRHVTPIDGRDMAASKSVQKCLFY